MNGCQIRLARPNSPRTLRKYTVTSQSFLIIIILLIHTNFCRLLEKTCRGDQKSLVINASHKRSEYQHCSPSVFSHWLIMYPQLRCSGSRPSCVRCTRLRRKCVYTDPSPSISPSETQLNRKLPTKCPRKDSPSLSDDGTSYLGIPLAVLHPLIDLYFSYIYNVSLLLHRASFLKAVANRSVRADILLSICSLAAKWEAPDCGCTKILSDAAP